MSVDVTIGCFHQQSIVLRFAHNFLPASQA